MPSDGYVLGSWSGDAAGIDNPLTLNIDANKAVTANFVLPPPQCGNWTLTTTVSQARTSPGAAWDPINHRGCSCGSRSGFVKRRRACRCEAVSPCGHGAAAIYW
jgi:hypothetical protein